MENVAVVLSMRVQRIIYQSDCVRCLFNSVKTGDIASRLITSDLRPTIWRHAFFER